MYPTHEKIEKKNIIILIMSEHWSGPDWIFACDPHFSYPYSRQTDYSAMKQSKSQFRSRDLRTRRQCSVCVSF